MSTDTKQHHTRSAANTQEFAELTTTERNMFQGATAAYSAKQVVKQDLQEVNEEGETMQQPNDIAMMLRQILEENKKMKEEIVTQHTTIKHIYQKIGLLEKGKINQQTELKITNSSNTNHIDDNDNENELKKQTNKQLQSKRIKQLFESKPFSGSITQEVSDWIDEFSDKCDELQLDDDQRLSIATGLLSDNAKLWYDTQKESISDRETLKNKLSTYFKLITGTDQFELEQKLHKRRRRQGEPAIDYCHQVLKLCSKVNKEMDELMRIKHLSKGLDAETQLHMDLKNPVTTEEFLQALIKYEKWQEAKPPPQNKTTFNRRRYPLNTTTKQPVIPQQQPDRAHQEEKQQQPMAIQEYQLQHPTSSTSPDNKQANTKMYAGCWLCGGMDHHQYACPKNY